MTEPQEKSVTHFASTYLLANDLIGDAFSAMDQAGLTNLEKRTLMLAMISLISSKYKSLNSMPNLANQMLTNTVTDAPFEFTVMISKEN